MPPQPRRSGPQPVIHVVRTPEEKVVKAVPDVSNADDTSASTQVVVTKTKAKKEPKPARVAPQGVPLPTMGLAATRYRVYCQLGFPDKGFKLSKKEIEAIQAEQARLDAIWQNDLTTYEQTLLDKTIIALSDRVGTQRVGVINTKGSSSRTTTLAHMASVHGTVTLAGVTAVDFNLASGNLGRRLGRDFGQTLPLSKLIGEHLSVEQYREFMRPIRPTPYNVRVVSADNIIKAGKKPNESDAVQAMEALYRFCDFLYIDTLNLITEPVALANVEFMDTIVFVANVDEQESLRQLGTSMETLREQGFQDKVNRAVVCISNIPEGMSPNDYRDYLHIVNDENQVVSWTGNEFKGQVVGIPHDPYLKLVRQVDLEALQYATLTAYKRLVIATLQQNRMFWTNPSAANVDLAYLGPKPERTEFLGFKFAETVPNPESATADATS